MVCIIHTTEGARDFYISLFFYYIYIYMYVNKIIIIEKMSVKKDSRSI